MIVFGLSTPNFPQFDEVQQQCHFAVVIGSSHRRRAKSPLGTVLIINLLGKGLTPRACMGDGGSIWWAPVAGYYFSQVYSLQTFSPQTQSITPSKVKWSAPKIHQTFAQLTDSDFKAFWNNKGQNSVGERGGIRFYLPLPRESVRAVFRAYATS